MSRVGNKIINVPEGVTVDIAADNTVTVTGAKGTLVRQFSPVITINKEDNVITVARSSEQKTHKQLHGTTRALLANMIEGVHEGFKKTIRNSWDWISWTNEREYFSVKHWIFSSSRD